MLIRIREGTWLNTELIKKIQINETKDSTIKELCIYMVDGVSESWHEPMLYNKSIEKTISEIMKAMNK
jgi:hypothetical protein